MYLKSRRRGKDDPKDVACANCSELVKVQYGEVDRLGRSGEWHCLRDVSQVRWRSGIPQQPWCYVCEHFSQRSDEIVVVPESEMVLVGV